MHVDENAEECESDLNFLEVGVSEIFCLTGVEMEDSVCKQSALVVHPAATGSVRHLARGASDMTGSGREKRSYEINYLNSS